MRVDRAVTGHRDDLEIFRQFRCVPLESICLLTIFINDNPNQEITTDNTKDEKRRNEVSMED